MNDMTCQELADLATDYFDGKLDPEDECRLAKHIAECFGCETYLDQFLCVIDSLGELAEPVVSDDFRKSCIDAFRDYMRLHETREAARAV